MSGLVLALSWCEVVATSALITVIVHDGGTDVAALHSLGLQRNAVSLDNNTVYNRE